MGETAHTTERERTLRREKIGPLLVPSDAEVILGRMSGIWSKERQGVRSSNLRSLKNGRTLVATDCGGGLPACPSEVLKSHLAGKESAIFQTI